jgi:hypothetical protein
MHQWYKATELEGAATSEEGEDIRQDLQEDHRVEDGKPICRNFHYTTENEFQDIVEGSVPSETEEETTNNRIWAMDLGALTTLGTFALTDR